MRIFHTLVPTHALLAASLLALGGCGAAESDAIDRELFVQTYVDLRVAAIEADSQRIGEPEREAILARNGVTTDDLLHFAEVYADDLDFMRDVWNDVELRMDRPPGTN